MDLNLILVAKLRQIPQSYILFAPHLLTKVLVKVPAKKHGV